MGMKSALLLGGVSSEREVSLMSGRQVGDALCRRGFAPLLADPAEDGRWLTTLLDGGVRRVFNILHGGAGENGEVRGALNCVGIACTGSGVLGAALAMNKHVAKQVWRAADVPTPDWRLAVSVDDARRIAGELPPPLFVKPADGGSSTNSAVVRDKKELPVAIDAALSEGGGALVERLIEGEEYTLSVVNDKPLPLIRIATARNFYDYEAKYVDNDTQFFCPCGLSADAEQKLAAEAMRAFSSLQCSHWGRVDFMLTPSGQPYFLEVNTAPGMTSHSLVPQAAAVAGMDFDTLVETLMNGATLEKGGGDG